MRGHDIFVSYSREDRGAARRFAALLEDEGFTVWWDAAIHSGESFDEVIERQLRMAKAAGVLWSPRSVASRWVRAEATLADKRHIFVPVIIEPCDLPIIFELTQSTDLSAWDGDRSADEWRRLIADIRLLVGPDDAGLPAPSTPTRGFLLGGSDVDGPQPEARPETPRAAPAAARHCEVEVRGGELLVTDLQSTNGTFIDGQRIEGPTILPPNSELTLGDVVLTHRVRELADLN